MQTNKDLQFIYKENQKCILKKNKWDTYFQRERNQKIWTYVILIVQTANYRKKSVFKTNKKIKYNVNQLKNVYHAMKSIG